MTLCRASLVGEILSEPENRHTQAGKAVTRVEVSTGQAAKIRLVFWGELAAKASELSTGNFILVSGNLATNSYKTAEGQPRKEYELVVRELFALPGGVSDLNPVSSYMQQKDKAPVSSPVSKAKPSNSSSAIEDMSEIFNEEEVPF